jgi:hypothetical protein
MPSQSFKPEWILYGFCAIIVGFVLYIGYHHGMFPLWFILLLLAAAGIVWWLAGQRDKKFSERFNDLARDLGLEVQEQTVDSIGLLSFPEAVGNRNGRNWKLTFIPTQIKAYGLDKLLPASGYISLSIGLPVVRVPFKIERRGPFSKLGDLFDGRSLTTGDNAFDRVWVTRSKTPHIFIAALTSETKAKLFAFAQTSARGSFNAAQTGVGYTEQGLLSDTASCERIKASLDVLTDLAVIAELNVDKKP